VISRRYAARTSSFVFKIMYLICRNKRHGFLNGSARTKSIFKRFLQTFNAIFQLGYFFGFGLVFGVYITAIASKSLNCISCRRGWNRRVGKHFAVSRTRSSWIILIAFRTRISNDGHTARPLLRRQRRRPPATARRATDTRPRACFFPAAITVVGIIKCRFGYQVRKV